MSGRVLVAGANGFVGAHILRELVRRGVAVSALTHTQAPWRLRGLDGVNPIAVDITDAAAVTTVVAARAPEIVINAAGYGVRPQDTDPAMMAAVNIDGAANLLRAADEVGARRFVHLGSYWEYGDHAGIVSETTPTAPKTLYGETKTAASAWVANHSGPCETLVLRLFNIWGAGEASHRLVPQVIRHCREKQPLDLTAGTQVKDFSYAPDVARWISDLALRSPPYSERILNLAGGKAMAVSELVLAVARALGGEHLMRFDAKPMPAGEVQTGLPATIRLDRCLPHRRATPLAEAVAEVIAETP